MITSEVDEVLIKTTLPYQKMYTVTTIRRTTDIHDKNK